MVHTAPEIESERIRSQHGEEQICQRSKEVDGNKYASKEGDNKEEVEELQADEDNVDEEYEPKKRETTRINTDWTLVGADDEDEAKGKVYEK